VPNFDRDLMLVMFNLSMRGYLPVLTRPLWGYIILVLLAG